MGLGRRLGQSSVGGGAQRGKHIALQGSETSGNTAVTKTEEANGEGTPPLTIESVNFPGLKKEMARLTTRQMKRVSKADQRLRIADEEAAGGKIDFREDETPDVLRVMLSLDVPPSTLETTKGQIAPPKSGHPLRMSRGIPRRDHF